MTAQEQTLERLREAIVVGDLQPGDRVPQEDLARDLGVSVAPLREALRTLAQEGQVTYFPRRGYFVTSLEFNDLREIYELRELLEERAARANFAAIDEERLELIRAAAEECVTAVKRRDVTAELAANRRFHFQVLDSPDHPHLMHLIGQLWDLTEAYRALYYNSPLERQNSLNAHARIINTIRDGDVELLIAAMNAHRNRALEVLGEMLDAGFDPELEVERG